MTSVLTPSTGPTPTQAPTVNPQPSTHPFTCNTCQVAFRSSEQQRTHMHTDWHRYNLKRRITSLPPLTSELFAEKVLHIQATNRLQKEKASFEKSCQPCGKTYFSENAYSNHLTSSKHKQTMKEAGLPHKRKDEKDETGSIVSAAFSFGTGVPDDEAEGKAASIISVIQEEDKEDKEDKLAADKEFAAVIAGLSIAPKETKETNTDKPAAPAVAEEKKEGEEEEEIEIESLSPETCLFCTYVSPTLQLNVSHMSKAHGLFIPEQKYLVDLPGLIHYLGEKVAILNECLYCQKQKGGLEGVRTHMRDVGHCKIAYETEEDQIDIGEFYDFRSTYEGVAESDDEDDADYKPRKGIRPVKKHIKVDDDFKPEDGTAGGDDAGWETDSSASSLDSTELCAVPIDHHHTSSSQEGGTSRGSHHKEDGWHSRAHSHSHTTAVYHTEYELHLPSGRTAGHRSLNRYYRQKLSHPLSERASRREEALRLKLAAAGNDSDAEEVDEFDADAEEEAEEPSSPNGNRGDIGRELTRRERRDLFFGRMGEEEKEALVGPSRAAERGISTRQLGLDGLSAQKRHEVRIAEKRGRMLEERATRRMQWHIDQKGNSQKHYRDPLLQ